MCVTCDLCVMDSGDHGECSASETGAECTCDAKWGGSRCDDCADNYYGPSCASLCAYCGTHARCRSGLAGDGACECEDGWTGESCDRCVPTRFGSNCEKDCPLCGDHGTCSSGVNGTGLCVCQTGCA